MHAIVIMFAASLLSFPLVGTANGRFALPQRFSCKLHCFSAICVKSTKVAAIRGHAQRRFLLATVCCQKAPAWPAGKRGMSNPWYQPRRQVSERPWVTVRVKMTAMHHSPNNTYHHNQTQEKDDHPPPRSQSALSGAGHQL